MSRFRRATFCPSCPGTTIMDRGMTGATPSLTCRDCGLVLVAVVSGGAGIVPPARQADGPTAREEQR